MFELSLLTNNLQFRFDSIVNIVICVGFGNILDFNVSSTLNHDEAIKNKPATRKILDTGFFSHDCFVVKL